MRNLPLLSDLSATMGECRDEDVSVRVTLPTTPISAAEYWGMVATLQVLVAHLDEEDYSGAPHPLTKGCTLAEGEAGPGRWAFKDAVPF